MTFLLLMMPMCAVVGAVALRPMFDRVKDTIGAGIDRIEAKGRRTWTHDTTAA